MRADESIRLVFIINGENFPIEASIEAPLIERALVLSGNTGRRDPREWEVRDTKGGLLDAKLTAKELRLKDGEQLFLSLRVGAGGAPNTQCN